MITLRVAGRTDTGHVRSANQDSFLVLDGRVYAVADGMGGHRGGEVASSAIVDTLRDRLATAALPLDADDVERAIGAANDAILHKADADPELAGMGSTLVMLSVSAAADGSDLLVIHNIGDSRAYRLRAGELDALSDDHSVVGEMVRSGRLTPEEARVHRSRSVLTRAMGMDHDLDVDRVDVTPSAGDRYLLCSDGLHGEITDAEIASALRRFDDAGAAADELVRLALHAGGRDNVTVIVVDVVGDGDAALAASRKVGRSTATSTTRHEPSHRVGKAGTARATGAGADGRSSVITPRLIAFVALLIALAVVVVWALVNAPNDEKAPANPAVTTVAPVGTFDPFGTDAPDPLLELPSTIPGGGTLSPPGVIVTSIITVPVGATTTTPSRRVTTSTMATTASRPTTTVRSTTTQRPTGTR